DPGAVEQHIEPAELAHRSRYCLGNRRSVAHVECDCDCPSAGGADPYGHSFGRSSVEIGAGDCGALARQAFSTGSADATTRTRHQRHFSIDTTHPDPPAGPWSRTIAHPLSSLGTDILQITAV